jgi:hypothetical protein
MYLGMNYPCGNQMLTIFYTNIKTSFVDLEEEYDTVVATKG